MNKDLTIILWLKDRAPFTWRWMEYYNQTGLPFKVIIADGGEDKEVEKLSDKSLFPNINYEYVRYPFDADVAIFFKKIYNALSCVQTAYVLFASNDDFYINDTLNKAIDFLDKNPDYVASRGEIYNFEVSSTGGFNRNDGIYGKIINLIKIYKGHSNVENSALRRVRIFSEFCDSHWHDVCRTDEMKECWKTMLDFEIFDLDLAENFMNYLLVASGKTHNGEGLHMLHQSHIDGLGHELLKADPLESIMTESWPKDMTNIFKLTAEKVSSIDKITPNEAYYKVMQYYICFILGKNTIKNRIERKFTIKPRKIFAFSNILSKDNKIRIFLREIYTYIKKRVQENKSKKVLKSFPYYEEIIPIRDFLLSHKKN